MKPIKCLLLLAAVLSFAALNAAYVPKEGEDADLCKVYNGTKYELACNACCQLKGKQDNWSTRWTHKGGVWYHEKVCVCELIIHWFTKPDNASIRLWERRCQDALNDMFKGVSINSEPDKASPSE
jgi:hypothetical protein